MVSPFHELEESDSDLKVKSVTELGDSPTGVKVNQERPELYSVDIKIMLHFI